MMPERIQMTGMDSLLEKMRNESGESDDEKRASLIEKIAGADQKKFAHFAWKLKNSELTALLQILENSKDHDLNKRILSIYAVRRTKNLFLLNWQLLANNFKNDSLWKSIELFSEFMAEFRPDFYRETLLSKIGFERETFVRQSIQFLKEDGNDIAAFMKKYLIAVNSDLAKKISIYFFSECDKETFDRNMGYFIKNNCVLNDGRILKNYLDLYDVSQYSDEVLAQVFERFGTEYEREHYWSILTAKETAKYMGWTYLQKIKQFFGGDQRKYRVWQRYHLDISSVGVQDGSGVLLIYFKKVVAIVPDPARDSIYLYKKNEFINRFVTGKDEKDGQAAGEDQAGKAEWVMPEADIKLSLKAKDAIINEKASSIYEMNAKEIGFLYIKDLLDREVKK